MENIVDLYVALSNMTLPQLFSPEKSEESLICKSKTTLYVSIHGWIVHTIDRMLDTFT